jgi:general secretion pathway protein F
MPVFEYHAYDAGGRKVSGVVDADSPRSARARLKQQGFLVTNVSQDTGRRELLKNPLVFLANRITSREVTTFTRQLSTLQTGGLTLIESLDALIEQFTNVRFKKVVTDIREKVLQGAPLNEALAAHPEQFDPLYVNLVKAGEASGSLDKTLARLAKFKEERLRQNAKITAAMVYPMLMTVIGSGVLLYLLAYVTPKVESMFADMRHALPLPTVILLFVSNILADWWWALILGAGGISHFARKYFRTEAGRERFDTHILNAPAVGNLVRSSAIARFSRALSTLLGGGVPLIESLKVTGKIAGNALIEKAIGQAIVNITEGQTISGPLKKSGLFPPLVTQMIDAGERTGSLPDMLEKISDAYEFEVETALSAMVSLLEPALIVAMGGVVGFIVMAILLPIFELSQMAR